jgi:hypothetical protein
MRIPSVRFSLRRMMVALAVVALMLRVGQLVSLSNIYRSKANECRGKAREWELELRNPAHIGQVEHCNWMQRVALYYQALTRKYEHASSRPWEAIIPDPPRPGDVVGEPP